MPPTVKPAPADPRPLSEGTWSVEKEGKEKGWKQTLLSAKRRSRRKEKITHTQKKKH
jgi:hypothetical protein